MTQYMFMNHRIKMKKPDGPVIVAQDDFLGEPRQREANRFDLWHHGEKIGSVVFTGELLAACDTHEVRAWIELDDHVFVTAPDEAAPKAPVAAEKKPNAVIEYGIEHIRYEKTVDAK